MGAAFACLLASCICFSVTGCCRVGHLPGVGRSATSCCCPERNPEQHPDGKAGVVSSKGAITGVNPMQRRV